MKRHKSLKHTEVYKKTDLRKYKFKSTKDLGLCKDRIGQNRAIDSIMFGLSIKKQGYNLFLSGSPGLGKKTLINSILKRMAAKEKVPNDWCYVFNFDNPKEPKAISIPPGKGKEFKSDMEDFIKLLRVDIPKAFESKEFEEEKNKLSDKYSTQKEKYFKGLREFGSKNSIQVQFTPTGIATVPLVNNKPAQQQQFENLDEKTKSKLRENKKAVDSQVAITLQNVRKIDKEYMDSIKELQNQVATFTVEGQIETLIEKYKDLGNIIKQLKDIKNDIVTNIDKFLPQKNTGPAMPFMPAQNNPPDFKRPLTEYQVNIYTDNSGTKGAPVIVES
ncbi:MAG: Lon-like protease helical domain-containing protein, partial [Thermodesulfobacteriota bacterium]